MRQHRLAVAAVLSLASALTAVDAPTGNLHDAVFFAPRGPVRLQLHVTIDGRSVDIVWNEAIDSLFALADRDGDKKLHAAERAAFVAPRRTRLQELADPRVAETLQLRFDPKAESISRAEFADALRGAGFGPINLSVVAGRADSEQLSAALFRQLDRDGDGRLSNDELKTARERLQLVDTNEDELVCSAELLGRSAPAINRLSAMPSEPTGDTSELVVFTPIGDPLAKQLLMLRGGTRATSLRREDLHLDAAMFARLDKDRNGRLDVNELAGWLQQPADLELTASFDAKSSLVGNKTALTGMSFQFQTPTDTVSGMRSAFTAESNRVREMFRGLATKSKVIRLTELNNRPDLLAVAHLADRKAAGEVAPTDVEPVLKKLAPLAACRVTVTLFDGGGGLFELLDRNGDGQLAPRELVDAPTVLKPFAGPDGKTGPNDLPHRFQIRAAVASLSVLAPSVPDSQKPTPKPVAIAPNWFTQMDRNGDGDVSLREYLGPIEMFRQIDTNADGLISPDEARAVNAIMGGKIGR